MSERELEEVVVTTMQGPQPVNAVWQRGGLAVHRGLVEGLGRVDWWTISHLRSGFSVRNYLDKDEAISLATELLSAGDWTRDYRQVVADAKFFERVRNKLKELGYSTKSKAALEKKRREAMKRAAI